MAGFIGGHRRESRGLAAGRVDAHQGGEWTRREHDGVIVQPHAAAACLGVADRDRIAARHRHALQFAIGEKWPTDCPRPERKNRAFGVGTAVAAAAANGPIHIRPGPPWSEVATNAMVRPSGDTAGTLTNTCLAEAACAAAPRGVALNRDEWRHIKRHGNHDECADGGESEGGAPQQRSARHRARLRR